MPVIKSAKKKLKQDKKRTQANKLLKLALRDALKNAQKTKTLDKVKSAIKLTDKSVKKGLIHKNKAARIKSRLSKLVKTNPSKASGSKKAPAKKTKAKKAKK